MARLQTLQTLDMVPKVVPLARSPTICPRRMTIRTNWLAGSRSLAEWLFLLGAVLGAVLASSACVHAGATGTQSTPSTPSTCSNATVVHVHSGQAAWAAAPQHCDAGACGSSKYLAAGTRQPRSLWPFFRDLDLLRLLEDAVSDSSSSISNSSSELVTECRADLRTYLQGLRNFSSWAVQMWDSSVRSPRGAMWGELWQMGNFDECLGAQDHPQLNWHIPGSAFCLAKLRLDVTASHASLAGSAWDMMKPAEHRLQVHRNVLGWGMCVPSSCGPRELGVLLDAPLKRLAAPLGLDAHLSVPPRLWQDNKALLDQSRSSSLAWTSLVWLVTWALLCTIVDSAGKSGSLIRVFSLRRNWHVLTAAADEREDIACIHVVRVICVLLVILGHRGEALMASPILNGNDLEEMYSSLFEVFIMNSSFIVDVFFVVGGCLLSWTLLGCMQRGKIYSIFALYAHRYARLVPAYAVTIAFLALGLPALGSGPLWGATVGEEAYRCQQRWWTNLLFINNVVRQDQPCLDPSWYLACDVQLFLLATPLVLLIPTNPRLARALLGLAFVVGVVYPAAVTGWLGLDGTIIPTPGTVGHMAATPIHMHLYVSSACRAGPYVAGVAAGWYLRHVRTRGQPAHPALRWALLPLLALALAAVAVGAVFFRPMTSMTPRWAHVAYAGLQRNLCAVACAVLVVVLGAKTHDKRSWVSAFRPWSRLSYGAYLTHALVQLYFVGLQRSSLTYSTLDTVTLFLPDAALAFVAALILHLIVEAPCNALVHLYKTKKQHTA